MELSQRPCDEGGFDPEEAHDAVRECVDAVLGGEDYSHDHAPRWTAGIVERSLARLAKAGGAYKYVVTCAVAQRSVCGLHTASSCFWDAASDGSCTVRWESRTMSCVVHVFAIAVAL
ncbi:hypothetical protein ACRRTK_002857 [Alexandromys fortis]